LIAAIGGSSNINDLIPGNGVSATVAEVFTKGDDMRTHVWRNVFLSVAAVTASVSLMTVDLARGGTPCQQLVSKKCAGDQSCGCYTTGGATPKQLFGFDADACQAGTSGSNKCGDNTNNPPTTQLCNSNATCKLTTIPCAPGDTNRFKTDPPQAKDFKDDYQIKQVVSGGACP
jgi:hypothetical protein